MLFDGRQASHRVVNKLDKAAAIIVQSPEAQGPITDCGDETLSYERKAGTLALTGEVEGILRVTKNGYPDAKWRSIVSYLFAGRAPNISVYMGQEGAEPPGEIRITDSNLDVSEQRALTHGEARLVARDLGATIHLQHVDHIADTMLDS